MSCDEHQLMISRLLDGELPPGASSGVFAHLAGCPECQLFYHRLQTLNASLEQVAGGERESERGEDATGRALPGRFWKRRVTVRFPILALLLCVVAAGILFSFFGPSRFRTPEAVYIAKFPAVVVTPEMNTTDQQQKGEQR